MIRHDRIQTQRHTADKIIQTRVGGEDTGEQGLLLLFRPRSGGAGHASREKEQEEGHASPNGQVHHASRERAPAKKQHHDHTTTIGIQHNTTHGGRCKAEL